MILSDMAFLAVANKPKPYGCPVCYLENHCSVTFSLPRGAGNTRIARAFVKKHKAKYVHDRHSFVMFKNNPICDRVVFDGIGKEALEYCVENIHNPEFVAVFVGQ